MTPTTTRRPTSRSGSSTFATDVEEALRILREGVHVADQVGDEFGVAVLWFNIGAYAATAGDVETALSASEEGLARARRLGQPSAIAMGTRVWASARWIDDPEAARAALEESMALTESGASDVLAGAALALLARLQAEAGDVLGALSLLRSAVSDSAEFASRISISRHLLYVAEVLGSAGIEPEVVGVLEGVVTRSPEMNMVSAGGRERELHDRAIETACGIVGPERFEELLARGGAMTYEQVVDYALTELDRIVAELE